MLHAIKNFLVREDGVTVVEYAVALAMIAAGTIIALTTLQDAVEGEFNDTADVINNN